MLPDDFTQRRAYNAVSDFVDANIARGLGDKLAFRDGMRSFTFKELQDNWFRHEEGAARAAHGKAA